MQKAELWNKNILNKKYVALVLEWRDTLHFIITIFYFWWVFLGIKNVQSFSWNNWFCCKTDTVLAEGLSRWM